MTKRRSPRVETITYTVNGQAVTWAPNAYGWVVTVDRGKHQAVAKWPARPDWQPQRPSQCAAIFYFRRADQQAKRAVASGYGAGR